MSNMFINIRFGCYHWQLDKRYRFRINYNSYHNDYRGNDWKWFQVYTWLGKEY